MRATIAMGLVCAASITAAEFCVDDSAFSAMLRVPIGIDLRIAPARVELGFEAVPAWRVAPASHETFLGGFFLRFYP